MMTEALYNGMVARVRGPVADILLDDGRVVPAIPRGALKRERRGTLLAVGDRVRVVQKGEDWIIEDIAPRERALVRRWPNTRGRVDVIVANPDQALFMFAVRDPHPRLQMLDRLLVIAEDNEIPAGVIVNKIDLAVDDEEPREIFADYEQAGYPVFYISVKAGIGLEHVREHVRDKMTVLAGPSGVGKSSLVNALEPSITLPTAEISRKWRQGRHTTVMAQLIPLREGGYIVDTPGLREVGLWGVDLDNLDYYFPEFRPYLGKCRFSDCRHLDEPGCAIIQAVEEGKISWRRYESYVNILLSEGM